MDSTVTSVTFHSFPQISNMPIGVNSCLPCDPLAPARYLSKKFLKYNVVSYVHIQIEIFPIDK